MRFSFADGTKVTLATDRNVYGYSHAVELDYTKKRVYWLFYVQIGDNNHDLYSCNYNGKNRKTVKSGPFNEYLLRVFRDSLYFMVKNNLNQMNVSNGNIFRSILVNKTDYYDLLVVDSSVQPMGEL